MKGLNNLLEDVARGNGAELRVRYHAGDMARIEVPLDKLSELCEPSAREEIVGRLRQLGFKFVTLDLAGFRSGGLNQLISPEELRRFSN